MTFPAGLAEDLGVHERTLRRAVNLGLARGGRRYHAQLGLAPGEEEYLRVRWPLLRDLREGLRCLPDVWLAVLYGPAARGVDELPDSVDLLVEFASDRWDRPRVVAHRLERAAGCGVRLFRLPRDPMPWAPRMVTILREGRVLADRRGLWRGLKRQRGRWLREARRLGTPLGV